MQIVSKRVSHIQTVCLSSVRNADSPALVNGGPTNVVEGLGASHHVKWLTGKHQKQIAAHWPGGLVGLNECKEVGDPR